ncbi:hypothetical protein FRC10_011641 [Ceratobasidium sp. 414]|nr:hypothetical protein FRC10_011641 [Ceratobasidium sp. 414]
MTATGNLGGSWAASVIGTIRGVGAETGKNRVPLANAPPSPPLVPADPKIADTLNNTIATIEREAEADAKKVAGEGKKGKEGSAGGKVATWGEDEFPNRDRIFVRHALWIFLRPPQGSPTGPRSRDASKFIGTSQLMDYAISEKLGEGSFGWALEVHKSADIVSKLTVALKRVFLHNETWVCLLRIHGFRPPGGWSGPNGGPPPYDYHPCREDTEDMVRGSNKVAGVGGACITTDRRPVSARTLVLVPGSSGNARRSASSPREAALTPLPSTPHFIYVGPTTTALADVPSTREINSSHAHAPQHAIHTAMPPLIPIRRLKRHPAASRAHDRPRVLNDTTWQGPRSLSPSQLLERTIVLGPHNTSYESVDD